MFDTRLELIAVPAQSGINAQPYGHEETLSGARNRIAFVKQTWTEYDYIVGIESGVFLVTLPDTQLYVEIAWVVIENKDGIQAFATSGGMEAPTAYVDEARLQGFENVTIGSITAKYHDTDATDPCQFYTNGLVSRQDLLIEGVRSALGQLARKVSTLG